MCRALGFSCWFSAWRALREVAASLWRRMAADGGAEAREECGEDGGGGVGGWGCMVEDEGWGGDAEVMVRWCWTGID